MESLRDDSEKYVSSEKWVSFGLARMLGEWTS